MKEDISIDTEHSLCFFDTLLKWPFLVMRDACLVSKCVEDGSLNVMINISGQLYLKYKDTTEKHYRVVFGISVALALASSHSPIWVVRSELSTHLCMTVAHTPPPDADVFDTVVVLSTQRQQHCPDQNTFHTNILGLPVKCKPNHFR